MQTGLPAYRTMQTARLRGLPDYADRTTGLQDYADCRTTWTTGLCGLPEYRPTELRGLPGLQAYSEYRTTWTTRLGGLPACRTMRSTGLRGPDYLPTGLCGLHDYPYYRPTGLRRLSDYVDCRPTELCTYSRTMWTTGLQAYTEYWTMWTTRLCRPDYWLIGLCRLPNYPDYRSAQNSRLLDYVDCGPPDYPDYSDYWPTCLRQRCQPSHIRWEAPVFRHQLPPPVWQDLSPYISLHQACGYLCNRLQGCYQLILLGDRGTWV